VNTILRRAALAAILTTGLAADRSSAQGQPSTAAAAIGPLLEKISTYRFGDERDALFGLDTLVRSSLSSPAELKVIEMRLVAFLDSNATRAAKDYALRTLSIVGTDASIPALVARLGDPTFAARAFYALTRIPSQASTDAMRKALDPAPASLKAGIAAELGKRRDAKAVPQLKGLLSSPDGVVAEAAAGALGHIGNAAAADAIRELRAKAQGPFRARLAESYLTAASHLASDGAKGPAIRAYKQLLDAGEEERIRMAALGALASLDPADSIAPLLAAAESNSPRIQTAAMRFLAGIPGNAATQSLIKLYPKLGPAPRAQLLAALADRGDTAAKPVFLEAAKVSAPEVRLAALAGIAKLGDGAVVPLLAATAASTSGAEQAAAREALNLIHGTGSDEAIVKALPAAQGKEKVELIMAAGERGVTAAATALVEAVRDSNTDVHRESLRALRNVAGPAHVPALLELLLQASTPADRREITQTLAFALKRSESASAAPVIQAYNSGPATPARLALLEIMGQTSAAPALPVLRSALKDSSAEIVRGAILALTEWGNPAPIPDLLAITQSSANPALGILALRGYIKLLGLPSTRSSAETAKMLGVALGLAKQPAEKRSVLSMLGNLPCKESLEIAEAAQRDEAVAKEAKAAVERIAGVLKFQ
jgi:HEAT repeat protein